MAGSFPLPNRVFSCPFNSRPPSHHRTHHSTLHFHGTKPHGSARFTGRGPRKMKPIKIRALSYPSGSGLEESVKKTIGENPVVVYSKTWCPYSSEVKSLFKQLGVQPLVIELDELGPQGPQLQMVLETLSGQHTVPNVFIEMRLLFESVCVCIGAGFYMYGKSVPLGPSYPNDYIFIYTENGGKHIGGCTDTVDLHLEGELEPLLLEATARKTES